MTQDKAETGSRINGGILRHPQASSGILRHSQALSDIPTVIPIISFLNEDIEQMFFLCEDIPTVIPILSFLKRRHRTKMMRKEEKERHITVCMNKFKGKHPKITQGFVEKLGELLSRLLVWFIKTP